MKKEQLLVGILSAEPFTERRRSCRLTWCRELLRNNIEYVFIVGNESLQSDYKLDDDILYLKCPDQYSYLAQKTRLFCKWAVENKKYKHILKCDDDSFLYVENICEYYKKELSAEYAGGPSSGEWLSGCGYFLSKNASKYISEHMLEQTGPYEDQICYKYMKQYGVHAQVTDRINGWSQNLTSEEKISNPEMLIDHYNEPWHMYIKNNILTGDNLNIHELTPVLSLDPVPIKQQIEIVFPGLEELSLLYLNIETTPVVDWYVTDSSRYIDTFEPTYTLLHDNKYWFSAKNDQNVHHITLTPSQPTVAKNIRIMPKDRFIGHSPGTQYIYHPREIKLKIDSHYNLNLNYINFK